MFAGMDDSKLDMALNMMQRAQKAKDVWLNVDAKTGGHLVKILVIFAVLLVGLFVHWLFFKSSGGGEGSPIVPNIAVKTEAAEDKFASEF